MTVLLLALTLVLLFFQVWTFYKVRKLHVWSLDDESRRRSDGLLNFSQLEALLGVYESLRPGFALPPTRDWAASPDFLRQVLYELSTQQPNCIVECSSGVSTLVVAAWLRRAGSGRVYSLEHDSVFAEKTRQLLERHGLASWATVIDAPLETVDTPQGTFRWYSPNAIEALRQIDLLVIDGPPMATGRMARYPAGPMLFNKLNISGVVLLDDANRVDEQAAVALWREEFPLLVAENVVSEKGLVRLSQR